jgi:hypothetical protein
MTALAVLPLLLALALWGSVHADDAPVPEPQGISAPAFPKVARAGDTALTITWGSVVGADGYEVHRYNSAQGRYVKVATLRSRATAKWTNKRLKTGKKYTYKVRAYRNAGLSKEYSDFTYPISAVPYRRDAKIVNAGATLKGAASMEIGLMQKLKVDASAVPSAYSTAKDKKVVDPAIRLIVTNPLLAVEGGSIVGKSVGTTHVYALAHNGNVKRIRVNVVDYARPVSWENLDQVGEVVADILLNCKEELADIASFLGMSDLDEQKTIELGASGELISEIVIPDENIVGAVKRILSYSGLSAHIVANRNGTALMLRGSDGFASFFYLIGYEIQDDQTQEYIDQFGDRGTKIAPHWAVYYSVLAG